MLSRFIVFVIGVIVFSFLAVPSFADTTSPLLPVSDGSYLQWATSQNGSHYAMVDESQCDGNSSYNYTNNVGRRDSYSLDLSSIPNGSTITQISVIPCASKNGSSGKSSVFSIFYRLNGINSPDKPGYSLQNSTPVVLSQTNYAGLSVTKDSTTTLEVGGVYVAGNKGVRLSNIQAVVTYSLPSNIPNEPSNFVLNTDVCGGPVVNMLLTWTDNSTNETSFDIEESDGTNYVPLVSLVANTTSYSFQGSSCDYRIRATNAYGSSNWHYIDVIR